MSNTNLTQIEENYLLNGADAASETSVRLARQGKGAGFRVWIFGEFTDHITYDAARRVADNAERRYANGHVEITDLRTGRAI